jgi:hypothetical protein
MYDNRRGDFSPSLMRIVAMAIRRLLFSVDYSGNGV